MKAFWLAIAAFTLLALAVTWYAMGIGPASQATPQTPVAQTPATPADPREGRAEVPAVVPVAAPSATRVEVTPDEADDAAEAAPAPGPLTEEERRGHTVGRLLGPQGAPLADTDFRIHKEARFDGGTNRNSRKGTTDGLGRFDIQWGRGADFEERNVVVVQVEREPAAPLVSAPQVLEGPVVRTIELGDLVLAPAPLLAAGTVLDGHGAPVSGAKLTVEHARSGAAAIQGRAVSALDGTFGVWGEPVAGTEPVAGPESVADSEHVLVATASGYRQLEPVAFAPGAAAVEVRMHATGALVGSGSELGAAAGSLMVLVLPTALDDAAAAAALAASLGTYDPQSGLWIAAGATGGERGAQLAELWSERGAERFIGSALLSSDGAFFVDGLLPGMYRVELVAEDQVLLAFDDVRVRAGEATADPRLTDFQLANIAPWLALSIVNSSGRRVEGAFAWDAALERRPLEPLRAVDGRLELFLEPEAEALRVCAPGYLAKPFVVTPGEHSLRLTTAPTIGFTLPMGMRPPAGEEWLVGLMPVVPGKTLHDDWWDETVVPVRENPLTGQLGAFVRPEALGPHHVVMARRADGQLTLVGQAQFDVQRDAKLPVAWPAE